MQRWAGRFSFLVNACLAVILIGAFLPGTHRFLCPACVGLTEIAPNVWTDAPKRSKEMLTKVVKARNRVASFFNETPRSPTIILCSNRNCANDFGIGGNGLSIGYLAVMVSPGGLTQGTLTHELTHSRLHKNMGLRNIMNQPFPTWFDEGLATHVANHPNWRGSVSKQARNRVRQAQRFWHWGGTMRALGVGQAYAAAAQEVAEIERRLGRDGLLELISQADAGESFETLLRAR